MDSFYTNVAIRAGKVLVRGIKNGQRFKRRDPYAPAIFLPSKEPDAKWRSLDGRPLRLSRPDGIASAKDVVKGWKSLSNRKDVPIYGLDRFEYAYLNETFPHEMNVTRDMVDVMELDIEVGSENGFPHPEVVTEPVTLITLGRFGKYRAYGYGDPQLDDPETEWIQCENEVDLLRKFIEDWESPQCPDIVTGWNVADFDIAYLARRILRLLGYDWVKRLSPWGEVTDRGKPDMWSKDDVKTYREVPDAVGILGVAVIDYMALYKKHTLSDQESWKLDHIAFIELDEKKIDYSEYATLHKLYVMDYPKFVRYGIKDTKLIRKLDDKKGLINLVLSLAYSAKVNYTDTFMQVRMWDMLTHNHLWQQNVAIPMEGSGSVKTEAYRGAWVKDPTPGLYKWVVSFDLNRLYPSLIEQYNISPEKLVFDTTVELALKDLLDPSYVPPVLEGYALAANGRYFRKDSKGFLPTIIERMAKARTAAKKRMLAAQAESERVATIIKASGETPELKAEKAKWDAEDALFDCLQNAKKVQLNSAYGALGSEYFRYFDIDQAEAITVSGQMAIQWVINSVNSKLNSSMKTEGVDYVLAADTDSMYVHLGPLVEKVVPGADFDTTLNFVSNVIDRVLAPLIAESFDVLGKRMSAFENMMEMKREVIADVAIWTGKKNYALNVIDSEGVRLAKPKVKIKGLSAIKSSTPTACKVALREALALIMAADHDGLKRHVWAFRDKFETLRFEEIAAPSSITNVNTFGVAGPHVRGALAYNALIKHMGLEQKYEPIRSGEKLKWCWLIGSNGITNADVMSIISALPPEFELEKWLDRDKQFDKTFLTPLTNITSAIGWDTTRPSKTGIDDFFA